MKLRLWDRASRLLLVCFLLMSKCVAESGPLQDLCPAAAAARNTIFINGFLCKDPAAVTAADFKNSSLSHAGDVSNLLRSSLNILTPAEFPGLNTMGLSVARTDIAVGGLLPLHSHPRASEMMYVTDGAAIAGFLDTGGRLFQYPLRTGDLFVFPTGLLHFVINGGIEHVTTFSFFSSQNPGVFKLSLAESSLTSAFSQTALHRLLHHPPLPPLTNITAS